MKSRKLVLSLPSFTPLMHLEVGTAHRESKSIASRTRGAGFSSFLSISSLTCPFHQQPFHLLFIQLFKGDTLVCTEADVRKDRQCPCVSFSLSCS
ncbi:hypothetical protein B0H14DRAFT_3875464 [Mycena olivaceomarginata]|nr:hypothetical protein B0H14DRAFT_3875464 [Mycena olivaceomarginata]